MKTDIRGCSTCPPGAERWEPFTLYGKTLIQYDYRTLDGDLFSQVFPNLESAHRGRDEWLKGRKESA
jgi:hypothetical protein